MPRSFMHLKNIFLSWGMLLLSVLFNAYGAFIIKYKMNELGEMRLNSFNFIMTYFTALLKSPLVVSGIVLFFLAPFLFAVALSRMEISVAYPAQVGLNFIFLLFLAVMFLGENLTINKAIGISLVICSIYFLHK